MAKKIKQVVPEAFDGETAVNDSRTPAQKQYWAMKQKHPDALLFFRMGDFYEMFGEDAKVASKILGLTLTSRDKSSANPIPMAGVPYHAVNKYIAQLSQLGYKIAIGEQITEPSSVGIVERAVVRVITPGTIVEDEILNRKEHNFLVSVAETNNVYAIAYLDTSTGDFFVSELDSLQHVKDELTLLRPAEVIFPKNKMFSLDLVDYVKTTFHCSVSWYELFEDPNKVLLAHFRLKNLSGFGVEDMVVGMLAAGYLLAYVLENQKTDQTNIIKLQPVFPKNHLHLDEATIRHLELFYNSFDGKRDGSLISILDRTQTSMGARLLIRWLMKPLLNLQQIEQRLEAVSYFVEQKAMRVTIQNDLREVSDLERILAKIIFKKALPRDLISLKQTIALFPHLREILSKSALSHIKQILETLTNRDLNNIQALIDAALIGEASACTEGNIIKKGYNQEVDDLRKIVFSGKDWLVEYQTKLQAETGINTLKVSYNQIFGYYIEVSKGQVAKAPVSFIRKQTLVNAERYITPELKEYEEKVVGAEEKLIRLEQKILSEIQEAIVAVAHALKESAQAVATLDVYVGLATLASDQKYVRPEMSEKLGVLEIVEGRHPVIEQFRDEPFIGNNLHLDDQKRIMLLTGPNMAGKSTYLRQNALIILMAQIGSFVPAKRCTIPVTDRIFTRIGASDILIKGQSTFLVEMQETANILNNLTDRSFVILDEVGRGTSTYDGLSLAWSILEYLHHNCRAKVLFATHYHELIAVTEGLSAATNFSMAVSENSQGVTFLHKVVSGGVDRSYGIEVAKISGLPQIVIDRARNILQSLETQKKDHREFTNQLSFLEPQVIETIKIVRRDSELEKRLSELDLNSLTPLQALNLLSEMKKKMNRQKE